MPLTLSQKESIAMENVILISKILILFNFFATMNPATPTKMAIPNINAAVDNGINLEPITKIPIISPGDASKKTDGDKAKIAIRRFEMRCPSKERSVNLRITFPIFLFDFPSWESSE